nr:PA14 domain-containing protein [Cohnella herbarum]
MTGEYFNNIDFVGLRNTRIDSQINFDWGTSIPTGINFDASDTFSIRWTGKVEAPVTGTYTFTTTSDDGVKVWVNGTMVIDHYSDHSPTDRSGTISLSSGTKYDIKIEYYNNQPNAVIKLYWAYPGQAQQIVPQSRLYP